MTVKEYLEFYKAYIAETEVELEQVERLRELATRASASWNPGGINPMPYDKVGEITAKIVDLENTIRSRIDATISMRTEIKGYIALIPNDKARLVIELRYLNGLSFRKIAERVERDVRTVLRRHKEGLNFLEENIEIS